VTGPAPSGWVDRLCAEAPFTALGLLRPLLSRSVRERAWVGPPIVAPADAPAFRLVTSNALERNREPVAWARAVLDADPDVLVAQEVTDAHVCAFRTAGGAERLPHSLMRPELRSRGTVLWSRLPLLSARHEDAGYGAVVASVAVDSTAVTVVGVHATSPTSPGKARRWRATFDTVAGLAEELAPGPLVCAGDWNATLGHHSLVDLLRVSGLRDAHTEAGRPDARTWPAGPGGGSDMGALSWLAGRVPPFALLDRVLLSDRIAVRGIEELTAPGSDHRAVAADLAVLAP
jgi:endonuclease/exonuclease/phosphatase family metal-dependent hydrolase